MKKHKSFHNSKLLVNVIFSFFIKIDVAYT